MLAGIPMSRGRGIGILVLGLLAAARCATGGVAPGSPAPAAPRPAPPLEGAWEGILDVDATTHVRAVLHLVDAASRWTATFDSPDQNGFGIPARNVRVTGNRVHAEVPDVPFSYDATLDGDRLVGTLDWKGRPLPLNLARRGAPAANTLAPPTAVPAAAEGIWSGALDINGIQLRLVFKVRQAATGRRFATATTSPSVSCPASTTCSRPPRPARPPSTRRSTRPCRPRS
jgi:hypothetical protein